MINEPLIECVPNFSEGRDEKTIEKIAQALQSVNEVKLLSVEPGKATHRTVMTLVGPPDAVCEAAFRGIKAAAQFIDMRQHKGEHPRMGATDVCPLIPLQNISLEETIKYAKQLGERVGRELNIPVYLYEYAASNPYRKNLANIRSGEYEGISKKINLTEWKPDYGPTIFNPQTGNTAIGVRDFLVAYNINLNTTSVKRANAVAFDVREAGRVKKSNDGKIEKDEKGQTLRIPGSCKSVKAIGWYIEEYGIAQISMNLTKLSDTPLHLAFEEVCKSAEKRGLRVTGSELIGLVPLSVLTDAGKYFLKKQNRSVGVSENELLKIAIKSLGLNELSPFDPSKKIIEYQIKDKRQEPLQHLRLNEFIDETASESPAPGGGSVAALCGALAAALATMVANLSASKNGWENKIDFFSEAALNGQHLKSRLLKKVDEDTKAFQAIMQAFQLPKTNTEDLLLRKNAIQNATLKAIETPLSVMHSALECFDLIQAMVLHGNPNSLSDSGVACICARSAVYGAYLNVKINVQGVEDKKWALQYLQEAEQLLNKAILKEKEILQIVNERII